KAASDCAILIFCADDVGSDSVRIILCAMVLMRSNAPNPKTSNITGSINTPDSPDEPRCIQNEAAKAMTPNAAARSFFISDHSYAGGFYAMPTAAEPMKE